MSHNLYVQAKTKDGFVVKFNLYQTPTEVTDRALSSSDPAKVYFQWAKGKSLSDGALVEFLKEFKDSEIEWYTI